MSSNKSIPRLVTFFVAKLYNNSTPQRLTFAAQESQAEGIISYSQPLIDGFGQLKLYQDLFQSASYSYNLSELESLVQSYEIKKLEDIDLKFSFYINSFIVEKMRKEFRDKNINYTKRTEKLIACFTAVVENGNINILEALLEELRFYSYKDLIRFKNYDGLNLLELALIKKDVSTYNYLIDIFQKNI